MQPAGIKSRAAHGLALLLAMASGDASMAGQTASKPRPARPLASPIALERVATIPDKPRRSAPLPSPRVADYGRLPIAFEPNVGQDASAAQFVARAPGFTLGLHPDRVTLRLERRSAGAIPADVGRWSVASRPLNHSPNLRKETDPPSSPSSGFETPASILNMKLMGANPIAAVHGIDRLPGKVNYYAGNDPKKWHTQIPTYARVNYQGVYPGVDLCYYGHSGALEYDFLLAPGASPDRIRLAFAAQSVNQHARLRVGREGDLVVSLAGGEVVFRKPVAYQPETEGAEAAGGSAVVARHYVGARYAVESGGVVGFEIAAYDRTRPLVIDPVLTYSTYTMLNNNGAGAKGIGVDASGNAYILGSTGAGGNEQVVVFALNAQGSAFLYTTYLGNGAGPGGIAVDSQGDAYITGTPASGFPTTPGAYVANCLNGCGAFIAKLLPSGTLGYSALPSGSGLGRGIAIDSSGAAFITGLITSGDLPVVNAFQPQFVGPICTSCSNAFVQKLDPTGSQLVYSTYFGSGGANSEVTGSGIAVDSSGSAYVIGSGAAVPLKNPLEQGVGTSFLAKFTPDGTGLAYSTLLGGSGVIVGQTQTEAPVAIAVDAAGNAYLTGNAYSVDFPLTMNAFRVSCFESAFEACRNPQVYALKVDPNGASLVYSTLIGTGTPTGIALDSSGSAWVVGWTTSNYFPMVQGVESSVGQPSDVAAFLTQLDPTGAPDFSTYLGGDFAGAEGVAVALDKQGNAYVTGSTGVGNDTPVDFPIVNPAPGTQGAAQFYTPSAVFVAKISPAAAGPEISLAPWYVSVLKLRNVGGSTLTISSITTSNNMTLEGGTCGSTLPAGGGCTLIVYPVSPQQSTSGTLTIASNAPGSPQTFTINNSTIGTNQVFVSANYLEFSAHLVGTVSATQNVTLTNLYFPNPVGISNVFIPPPDPTEGIANDFTQTNNCPASLAPGASCTITLQYQPVAGPDQADSGQLQIVTDTPPHTIFLAGVRSSESLIAFRPGTLAGGVPNVQFGAQYVGATPLPRVLALTNVSTLPVSVSGFSIVGPFTQTNNCSALIAPHASCRVAISFLPTGNMLASGTLTATYSGQGGTLTVTLGATGEILSDLAVSPLALDFGTANLGTSYSLPLTLTNSSQTTLAISAFNLSANFTQTNNCNGSLTPRAACTVNVTFTPSAVGDQSGTLSIVHSGKGSPQVISLTAAGGTPLRVTPSSLTFGEQAVGTVSAPQSVDVSNQGSVPVTISGITASGDFQILPNFCPNPYPVFISCALQIAFAPTAAGLRSGTLTINASDSPNPHLVALSGTGALIPDVSLSSMNLTFAPITEGSTSAPQTVTLKNIGKATLTMTSVVATGDFAQTNTCGNALAAGASCSISVTFTPVTGGTRNGTLTLADNAPDSPQTVTLSGTGNGPGLSLSPTSLSFPAALVGTTGGGSQSVFLANFGNATLTITSITASGDFAVTNNPCPSSLDAGNSCQFNVIFKPTAGGTRTGSLTVVDNAYGSPHSIPLTGTGTDFMVAIASGSSSTQTVSPGQTATYSLAFSGTSQFSGSVSLACSGAPSLASCTVNPTAVLLNGTSVLNATVSVATTGGAMGAPQTRRRPPPTPALPVDVCYWLLALVIAGGLGSSTRLRPRLRGRIRVVGVVRGMRLTAALLLLLAFGALAMPSCGGGGGGGGNTPPPGTPAGTYILDVTATFTSEGNTLIHNIKLTLVVN